MDDLGPLKDGCDPATCTDRVGGEHSDRCERRSSTDLIVEREDGTLVNESLLNRFAFPVLYGPAIRGECE